MKRDPDLIRELLNYLEDNLDGINSIESTSILIPGYSESQIAYHTGLLQNACLIKAALPDNAMDESLWFITGLTWAGHEFIEAARNDKNWNKVINKLKPAGGFVMEIAKPLLVEFMKETISQGM